MANSTLPDIASMDVKSQIYWVRENFIQPTGLLQIAVIGVTYLIARIIYTKIRQHLEKDSEKVKSHARFALSPAQFAIMLGYVLWLLLLWFCRVLFEELQMPSDFLRMAVNLAMAWLFLRFAYFLHQEHVLVPPRLHYHHSLLSVKDIQALGTDRCITRQYDDRARKYQCVHFGTDRSGYPFHMSVDRRGRGQPIYGPPIGNIRALDEFGPGFVPKGHQGGDGVRRGPDLS